MEKESVGESRESRTEDNVVKVVDYREEAKYSEKHDKIYDVGIL